MSNGSTGTMSARAAAHRPLTSAVEDSNTDSTDAHDIRQAFNVDALIKERFSCRFFLDREVERHTIEEIVDIARFAPSGNNIQPWEKVYCLSGPLLETVREEILRASQDDPHAHKAGYSYYPPPQDMPEVHALRKQEFGRIIGMAMGVDREDTAARAKAAGRNYEFYGAPVALIFTISKRLEKGSWIDLGYFLQSVCIAARSRGLETCSQESIAQYHRILRQHLPISDDEVVAVSISVGYPDKELVTRYAAPQPRREVDDILQFYQ
ncbi:nitroreductase [Coprinopsis sp. MPI-PUGE-AT-0042]|nr:nitroreductase [Coprinopsis sp. MPI-PUGE-AT-0042]